jgi:hypothetical protein
MATLGNLLTASTLNSSVKRRPDFFSSINTSVMPRLRGYWVSRKPGAIQMSVGVKQAKAEQGAMCGIFNPA